MDCERCRDLLSARLDGEEEVVDGRSVDPTTVQRHLDGCPACTAFAGRLTDLHRWLRVQPVSPVPNLAPEILAAAPPMRSRQEPSAFRLLLGGVGLVLLLVAFPLLLHEGGGDTVHNLTRELAAFQAALGLGFVLAAWQPARVAGMFPVALTVVTAMVFVTLVDLLRGEPFGLAQSQNLFELAGVVLMAAVARSENGAGQLRRSLGFA